MTMWTMINRGYMLGRDGRTPYNRRFGRKPRFQQRPFGSLVFVAPRVKGAKNPKWQPKMIPYELVNIGVGPPFDWNRTYDAVQLKRLLDTEALTQELRSGKKFDQAQWNELKVIQLICRWQ